MTTKTTKPKTTDSAKTTPAMPPTCPSFIEDVKAQWPTVAGTFLGVCIGALLGWSFSLGGGQPTHGVAATAVLKAQDPAITATLSYDTALNYAKSTTSAVKVRYGNPIFLTKAVTPTFSSAGLLTLRIDNPNDVRTTRLVSTRLAGIKLVDSSSLIDSQRLILASVLKEHFSPTVALETTLLMPTEKDPAVSFARVKVKETGKDVAILLLENGFATFDEDSARLFDDNLFTTYKAAGIRAKYQHRGVWAKGEPRIKTSNLDL